MLLGNGKQIGGCVFAHVIRFDAWNNKCYQLITVTTFSRVILNCDFPPQYTHLYIVSCDSRHYTAKACAYLCQHHLRRHGGVGEFGELYSADVDMHSFLHLATLIETSSRSSQSGVIAHLITDRQCWVETFFSETETYSMSTLIGLWHMLKVTVTHQGEGKNRGSHDIYDCLA